tara:strand:- start:653 stop:1378 length:726 start_codon:yes stop_codon:yes gene_type:complete
MNEENYILFDQYLQEELSNAEKINFEKELTDNPELAAAFGAFKEANEQLEVKFGFETERNAFIDNLKAIFKEQLPAPKAKVVQFKPWMYMAAASVALLFGIFVFNSNSNPSFDDYNQYENAYFTERGDAVANVKLAETAFNDKKYQEAIPLFEALLKENKTAELQYYYGVALLETNKTKEAEVVFNELQSGNSIYKNKAIWSLALAKLKQKEYKACKEILLTIPADYENYDQVQKLLKDLD